MQYFLAWAALPSFTHCIPKICAYICELLIGICVDIFIVGINLVRADFNVSLEVVEIIASTHSVTFSLSF